MSSRKTEEHAPQGPRSALRRIVETLVVVAIVVGIDVLLTYALFPYGSLSEVVWSEYSAAADQDIDAVIVGSSTAQRSFDPNVLDDELGTSSFTLASPAQPLSLSYLAVSEAIADHKVSRVILGLDYETMSLGAGDNSSVSYIQAKASYESLPKALYDYAGMLTDPEFFFDAKCLDLLFPWTILHVKGGLSGIASNIEQRMTMTPIDAAEVREPAYAYVGKGYGNYEYLLDTTKAKSLMSTTSHPIGDFTDDNMAMMQKIIDLCRENNVQLVVVVTPRPAFNVLNYGNAYPEQMTRMRNLVESSGCVFLDANLLKRSHYAPTAEDFGDGEHLNAAGAEEFSAVFAEYLQQLDAGEDASEMSYSYEDWSDYLASIDYISAVTLDGSVENGVATLEATPYTGTSVQVEYQFCLCDEGGNVTSVLQDWSPNATVTCEVPADGSLSVRVNARQVGSNIEYEQYCVWSSS